MSAPRLCQMCGKPEHGSSACQAQASAPVRDDGGPAFPAQFFDHRATGMTLRDYFAAKAPAAPQWWWDSYKSLWGSELGKAAQHEAQWRYVYAAAMLAERRKS